MNIKFEKIVEKFCSAKKISVLTGAGISAESGVPTFRGENGIWNKLKPEELANFSAFMRNPRLVWEWYEMRKNLNNKVQPNAGHYALVELEEIYQDGFSLTTQNVDNLHHRAGSKRLYELHGNIDRSYCVDCLKFYEDVKIDEINPIPHCSCGGLIRPDVVWFGENLPEDQFEGAVKAAEDCDIYISIGTSGNVYPAASLPEVAAGKHAYLIEINIEPSLISSVFDEILIGKSGEILPEIVKQIKLRKK
jgi:NAD-dependent deacetylase